MSYRGIKNNSMKSIKYFGLVLCIISVVGLSKTVHAQRYIKGNGHVVSQERTVSDFTGIKVVCSADVIIHQGEKSVVVKSDENLQEIISTKVVNNLLVIDIEGSGYRSCKVLEIHVNMPTLQKVLSSGSGDVKVYGGFEGSDLTLELNGSGDFDGELNMNGVSLNTYGSGDTKLSGVKGELQIVGSGSGDFNLAELRLTTCTVKLSGSGDATLQGKCENLTAIQKGSGDLNAYALATVNAEISNYGSSDVMVNVATSLNAVINGSGDLTYSGNPQNVEVKANGSGDVYRK